MLKRARSRALRLLSYRQRSRHEVETYLQRKGYSGAVIATVVAEMREFGYVDDARFTGEFLQQCLDRGFGPYRAGIELRKKGIARELIENGIGQYFNPEEDLARARIILEKRIKSSADLEDKNWIRRQAQFLKRRGFHDYVIMRIIRDFLNLSPD